MTAQIAALNDRIAEAEAERDGLLSKLKSVAVLFRGLSFHFHFYLGSLFPTSSIYLCTHTYTYTYTYT